MRTDATVSARTGTFTDNLRLSVHRWFRYSAGFSGKWVESVLREKQTRRLFDPFAGSGTALLAADALGTQSVGAEAHPFVKRIATAKTNWNFDVGEFCEATRFLLKTAAAMPPPPCRMDDPLLGRIYTEENLAGLDRLRLALLELENTGYNQSVCELLRLALTSILRPTSCACTAQCQYVLPAKTKKNGKNPFGAINAVFDNMLEDRRLCELEAWQKKSGVVLHDSRTPFNINGAKGLCEEQFDTVITSPPYPNNYDYADATRIEMTFWGEISGWCDLQSKVRANLMRSCSQHSAAEHLDLKQLLAEPRLGPIIGELGGVCERLAEIRHTKGGKKTYHTMVAAYFKDLADVFHNLRPITTGGAAVCFVIGDSAPYGVHIPVERWLGELALSAGFKKWRFEKRRDRNVKWENRVHDVPLKEGNLWIDG